MFSSLFKQQWKIHTNPDGSKGGQVSVNAKIIGDVFIPAGAIVSAGAKVDENIKLNDGDYLLPDNSIVRCDKPLP